MDFGLDKEQEMLRKSFSEFLTRECPPDTIRDVKNSDQGYSKGIWKKMAQLGWMGLFLEEQYGGSQIDFMDLFILFEEMGKVLLPSPLLFCNVLPGLLIQDSGSNEIKNRYLPLLVDGKTIIPVALFDEKGVIDKDQPGVVARKSADGYLLKGTRLLVPYIPVADKIILCVKVEGDAEAGPTLMCIDREIAGLTVTDLRTITDEKRYHVAFENSKVTGDGVIGDIGKGSEILERVLQKAIVLKCGEMIGGLRHLLDITVAYSKTRQQFGRPIGSFQAIQHHCADMAILLDSAVLIAYQAASLMSRKMPCVKEVAMAKAWCNDAYKQATWISHQVHGAIGFTEELNIHWFYKHAKESELMFGHSRCHRAKVADEMGI